MLDKGYFENGHLKRLAFLALEEDLLDSSEKQLLISHINSCDDCMDSYLSEISELELLSPSEDFYETLNLGLEAQKKQKAQNEWHKLRIQALKLVVAACVTIVVFIGSDGLVGLTRGADEHLQPNISYGQRTTSEAVQKPGDSFFNKFVDSFQQGFFDLNTAFKFAFGKGDNRNGK